MGYYVNTTDVNLRIPADRQADAYEALCRLNWRNDLKRGGVYRAGASVPDGPHPDIWFSWLQWNYHETCDHLECILVHVGFETFTDDAGTLHIVHYDDKTGCEDIFLEALAPFYDRTNGEPFVEWHGEDDDEWRDTFMPTHIEHQRVVRYWGDPTLQSYRVN